MVFVFWYSNNITNFKFEILIINFFVRVHICVWFYIRRFHFSFATICIIIFINCDIWFVNVNIFWHWSHGLINFIFQVLNLSATTNVSDFPSLWNHFFYSRFNWYIVKFTVFIFPYFVWFAIRLEIWKALVMVIPFLHFNGITHAYLLKILTTHNKIRMPLLSLLINCRSYAPNIVYKSWRR